MAALPAGGLKATTLEGALLEVSQLLQIAEQAATPPQSKLNLSVSTDTNTANISVALPIAATISAAGEVAIAVVPYA